MSDDFEVRESAKNGAVDAYIDARPQLDSIHNRRVFEAGFDRAWTSQQKEIKRNRADIAELVGVLELCRPYIHAWPQCRDNLLLQVAAAIVKYDNTTTKET